MRLCLLPWLVIHRLLVLLSLTCEAEGAYVRSEASIKPSGGVSSRHDQPLNTLDTHHHHEHLKALWDGVDLPTEVFATLSPAEQFLQSTITSEVDWGLLGPFDSGTNLFDMSVRSNFPQLAKRKEGPWKHSTSGANAIATAFQQHIAPRPLTSMVLVLMVRSPLSLISSWKKASYNLGPCIDNKQYTDMTKSCQAKTDCLKDQDTGADHSFSGVADIYNTYLRQYQQLQTENQFKQIMLVTYEDMILNPKAVMKKFAHAMDIAVDEKLDVVDDPAKEHGDATGRAEALTKLKNRPWLAEMGSSGIKAICPNLAKELVLYLKEGNDGPHNVPYDQDCKDHST